jgi:hypothetical protein
VDAFWTDLSQLVRKWAEAGKSVVLLADWNADIRGEKTRKYMADLCMRGVIMEFHGGKEQQSGHPVDVTYCIFEHGKQDRSVRPLRNWMLYSQISHCKLDILRSDGM